MLLTPVFTPSIIVVYLAAAVAATIDNSQVFDIGDGSFTTTDGIDALAPSQTTIPTSSNSASSFGMSTTASPESVSLNQADRQIEQGPNGVKTVINGDQTIIDGPSGKTFINGGKTIIQTQNSHGGQTMVHTDEGSTGGAAMATGFPLRVLSWRQAVL
jgi:hypothetical protein